MHLELQWTMWMPLTFWAVHRAVAVSARSAPLVGVFLWLQIISCVYYGVFLAMVRRIDCPAGAGGAAARAPRRAGRPDWRRDGGSARRHRICGRT